MFEIDKRRVRNSFVKAIGSYEKEATIQRSIAGELYNLLSKYSTNNIESLFEIGCGTGFLTRLLLSRFPAEIITVNDLCAEMKNCLPSNIKFVPGDAEFTEFPRKYNLITSSSAIQWISDLPAFLEKADHLLLPDGIIAFSTFGEKNLAEIKQITGSGLSYYTKIELEKIVGRKFTILEVKEDIHSLCFESPMDILIHLKRTGVNGITPCKWSKTKLKSFIDEYNNSFRGENGLPLTYHPIYIIASKKAKI